MSIQRKRCKNGGDISSDLEALQMEDLDSSVQPFVQPQVSYASTLKNPIGRFSQTMSEPLEFSDDDVSYTMGKHGLNVSFSEKVHNKLDLTWRCAVIVKLMGKPNSTNSFDFMLKGLRRKWQVKGGWQAMRKIKNEFMAHWDGLLTKSGERILVLAATNRPFDLDEAIIRRFERRVMVGLPSVENREMILKTLLAKEKVENLDFKELATMTEGYSGSDLKNLCVTAAYRPVRELIQQERLKDQEKKKKAEAAKTTEDASDSKEEEKEERVITLRSLSMEDMRQAKNQVAASFAAEGSVMNELKQWNDLYGEGGSRKKEQLTYFL